MFSVPEDKKVLLIPSIKHKSEARVRDMASLGNMYWDAAERGRVHQAPLHSFTQRSYLPVALGAPHFHFQEKSLAAKKNRNKTKITVPPNGHQKNKGVLLPSTAPKSLFFMGCCMTKFARKCRDCGFTAMTPHNQGLLLPRRTLGSDVSKGTGP